MGNPDMLREEEAACLNGTAKKDAKQDDAASDRASCRDDISVSLPDRDQWSSKAEFMLSVIGFAVGLGNVWRFPYLCYKNGGGAFFIPYFICLLCGGVPIFCLEVALGQYMSQGGLGAWRISPIFQGVGIATTVVVSFLNIYYIVVLAWDLYYASFAFSSVLPWSHCDNDWNTDRCRISFGQNEECLNVTGLAMNGTSYLLNNSSTPTLPLCDENGTAILPANFTPIDPVVEFWERKILQISGGIDEPNGLVWPLVLTLAIVWIMCYFCIFKGVQWTGKVVYFTATFPYLMLSILLVRGVALDGAAEGILFFLKPDFTKLADAGVWLDAGTQIFFSYALALGAMTALGSYNKFNNNCYRDCILISAINSGTSIFAGFVIFSVLGFMAKQQGVSVDQVAESGPGLVFIAYPKAITQMPLPQLWAILFFFMVLMLGLNSQFVGMEAVVTVGMDLFPQLRKGFRKQIFVAVYSFLSFLIGLSMVTRGGMYVFQLFDYYSASGMALLWICCFEAAAIGWVYGAKRFYDNMEQMIGYRVNPWLSICWRFLTPTVCAGIFFFMWSQFKGVTYNKTYIYPGWAQALGLFMALSSMVCIPVYILARLLTTPGTWQQRWRVLTTPVLIPDRIPPHWPDADKLEAIAKEGEGVDILLKCQPNTDKHLGYYECQKLSTVS